MMRTEQTARKDRMATKPRNQEQAGQPATSFLPRLQGRALRPPADAQNAPRVLEEQTVIFMPVRAIGKRIYSFSMRRQSLNFFAYAPLK